MAAALNIFSCDLPCSLASGDFTVVGWLICLGYLVAGGLCGWAFYMSRLGRRMALQWAGDERRRRVRRGAYLASGIFWMIMAVVCLFLGINKQLDLQTWLTDWGRDIALEQGWYQRRGVIQARVVACIGLFGMLAMAILLPLMRDLLRRHVMAFIGIVLIGWFVAIRTGSFSPVEAMLGFRIAGLKFGWLLELIGIGLIGVCAFRFGWWYRAYRRDESAMPSPHTRDDELSHAA
jgi:hypothetical protein